MEDISFSERPSLRNPVLIGAFAGWNDAAGVATAVVQFLVQAWSAVKFATVDPEEYYVFTRVRPQVFIDEGKHRRIEWPANDFYYHVDPDSSHDFILLSGIEPQLKWKRYTRQVLDLAQEFGVATFMTLGGFLRDVAHTQPSHLSASASDPELLGRLKGVSAMGSRYEGPTGILGVLNTICRDRGMPTATMWGSVSHYLSSVANPRVTRDMLKTIDGMFDLKLVLRDFNKEIAEFDSRVADAIARNPELSAYVRQLEERDRSAEESTPEDTGGTGAGTGSESILKELENFLKQRREENSPDGL
ncbi:MAG: PAC2 family protein [Dehalococcoidia bacterium]|nr:PAC2 family protein [Dehalococcoidia bacterium]